MVEEEAGSKAEKQPWKNIWAENGRDICQEAFPTGLGPKDQVTTLKRMKHDMKEEATLIRIHEALCLSSTCTTPPPPPIMYPFFSSAPHSLNFRPLSIVPPTPNSTNLTQPDPPQASTHHHLTLLPNPSPQKHSSFITED